MPGAHIPDRGYDLGQILDTLMLQRSKDATHSRALIRRSGHAIDRQALVLGHVDDVQHRALDQSGAEYRSQFQFI